MTEMNGLRQNFWLEIRKLVRACVHIKFMEKSQVKPCQAKRYPWRQCERERTSDVEIVRNIGKRTRCFHDGHEISWYNTNTHTRYIDLNGFWKSTWCYDLFIRFQFQLLNESERNITTDVRAWKPKSLSHTHSLTPNECFDSFDLMRIIFLLYEYTHPDLDCYKWMWSY